MASLGLSSGLSSSSEFHWWAHCISRWFRSETWFPVFTPFNAWGKGGGHPSSLTGCPSKRILVTWSWVSPHIPISFRSLSDTKAIRYLALLGFIHGNFPGHCKLYRRNQFKVWPVCQCNLVYGKTSGPDCTASSKHFGLPSYLSFSISLKSLKWFWQMFKEVVYRMEG